MTRDRRLTIAPSRPYDFIDVSAGHNCNATYGPAAVAPRPVRGQSGRAVGQALSQQAPELAFCTLPPLFVPLLLKPRRQREDRAGTARRVSQKALQSRRVQQPPIPSNLRRYLAGRMTSHDP